MILRHITVSELHLLGYNVYLHVTGRSDRAMCWTIEVHFHEGPESFLLSVQSGFEAYKILYL